jgi:hypothetical protein
MRVAINSVNISNGAITVIVDGTFQSNDKYARVTLRNHSHRLVCEYAPALENECEFGEFMNYLLCCRNIMNWLYGLEPSLLARMDRHSAVALMVQIINNTNRIYPERNRAMCVGEMRVEQTANPAAE